MEEATKDGAVASEGFTKRSSGMDEEALASLFAAVASFDALSPSGIQSVGKVKTALPRWFSSSTSKSLNAKSLRVVGLNQLLPMVDALTTFVGADEASEFPGADDLQPILLSAAERAVLDMFSW
jgi:hypothetical protein